MSADFLGAVKLFAGGFAIKGYALANGQTMSIQQNAALFSLLGTTFGGNGVTTFLLPNLQSRIPLGQGNGVGLTPRVMGETGGVENVQLTTSTVPPHLHSFNATQAPTTTGAVGPTVLTGALQTATDGEFYAAPGQPGFTTASLSTSAVSLVGGNLPHNNIQPSIAITYLIALTGIYPSRN
jgi:microcystin-dependent protein